jgi:hypothetical protein
VKSLSRAALTRAAAAGRLPDPCGLADIAPRFGHSVDWLQRNWRRLVDKHGFPRPLPLTRCKWAAAPVERWFEEWAARSAIAPIEAAAYTGDVDAAEIDALARELDARAGRLAGGPAAE